MTVYYPLLTQTTCQIFISALLQRPRSFHADARALAARLQPPLQVRGKEHIPRDGPCVITVNHYTHPGFPSWWITLSVSAAVPAEIHWIMAEAWAFPDKALKRRTITPLTRWSFARIARIYGFTTMPPMPPHPGDTARRAHAVRQALACARKPGAILGLAPEGSDLGNGVLQAPPPGAGRFMLHLAGLRLTFVPAGLFQAGDCLHVCFGPHFNLAVPSNLPAEERDRLASQAVMQAIARLIPVDLRGEFQRSADDPQPMVCHSRIE